MPSYEKAVIQEEKAVYEPVEKKVFSPSEEDLFQGTLRQKQKDDEEVLKKAAADPEIPLYLQPQNREKPKFTEEQTRQEEKPVRQSQEKTLPGTEEKQLELFEENLLSPESRKQILLIGQVFDTYWLAQFGDEFFIIDQHAAHEKVYYERFVKKFRENTVESQFLNPPLIVTLKAQEEALLNANRDYFHKFGFEIEHFGGKEYCISAVPSNLYGLQEEELFLEMLDHLAGEGDRDALDIFASRLATMACKAAVKGNHSMSKEEAEKLIDELLTLDNPYHCPHGRPTIISMTKTELEKKFKRIV